MRSVRLQHSTGQALSSVSLSKDQTFAATGCGSHVEIIRLDTNCAQEHVTMQLKATGRFTVTDVAFAPNANGIVAASGTNGMIAVFDFNTTKNPVSTLGRYTCLWDSGEAPRSMNKVSWHSGNNSVLLSSGMDGLVRLYDLRQKQECQGVFNPRSEATRDVSFNPFSEFIFAALSENGALSIWDCRNADSPVLKISAHTMFGLSLAWNPSQRDIIATGSRDKTVKVWDIQQLNRNDSASEELHVFAEPSYWNGAYASAPGEKEVISKEAYKPLYHIHTPSSVGRIRWRNGEKYHNELATASSSTESAGGEVLVWNMSMPNTPACVLKGHVETCSDFQWLDTPMPDLPSEKGTQDSEEESFFGTVSQESAPARPVLKNKVVDSSSTRKFMGVHQHILSVGKDGMLLVQDVRNAFFPRQHMSSSVTAISSQGHVAFQRGKIFRSDPIGLVSNKFTANAPGWFRDEPRCFGMKIPTDSSPESELSSVIETTPPISQEIKNLNSINAHGSHASTISSFPEAAAVGQQGQIFLGLANINFVEEAHDIRKKQGHGAEGGVFDPAMMSILARSYQLGSKSVASVGNGAVSACEHNLQVAKKAGLHCRAGLWATALSILSSMQALGTPIVPDFYKDQSKDVGVSAAFSNAFPHSGSNMPPTIPFGVEILGSLLQELLEGGDCQHFVVLCEVLKYAGLGLLDRVCATTDISVMQRREVYLAYFELLGHLKLFTCVNFIVKDSNEEYISRVSRQGVNMHTSCAKCGKELPDGIPWCKKCSCCAAICSLCHCPVRGLMHWCPICGHGGHLECMKLWFKGHSTCPSGCGHDCYLKTASF